MLRHEIALQKCRLDLLILLVTCVLLAKLTKAQEPDTCFAVSLATVTVPKTNVKLTTSIKKKLDSAIVIVKRERRCVVKVIALQISVALQKHEMENEPGTGLIILYPI
jgi:hypothetical protein